MKWLCLIVIVTSNLSCILCQRFGPASILQDSRLEPKVDGTFGFLYRTEDGITSAARGNPDGKIQGRFTYTDPTGLKVNFNYNAGSRRAPGYTNDGPEDDGTYDPRKYETPDQNLRPQPAYEPQSAPPRRYTSQYLAEEESDNQQAYNPPPPAVTADIYQQRRTRPRPQYNDVYEQPRVRYNPRY